MRKINYCHALCLVPGEIPRDRSQATASAYLRMDGCRDVDRPCPPHLLVWPESSARMTCARVLTMTTVFCAPYAYSPWPGAQSAVWAPYLQAEEGSSGGGRRRRR